MTRSRVILPIRHTESLPMAEHGILLSLLWIMICQKLACTRKRQLDGGIGSSRKGSEQNIGTNCLAFNRSRAMGEVKYDGEKVENPLM